MTPTRHIGDAPCEPASATLLRFAGNCTATVSATPTLSSLRAALHDAVVTAGVRLVSITAIVMSADCEGYKGLRGHRVQYVPLIVRFLPVLQ
jgi:hypothetical protein